MSWTILRISLFVSLLLVVTTFFLYRGAGWPLGLQGMEAAIAFALLLALNLAGFLSKRGPDSFSSGQKNDIASGLMIGLLWTAEISMNNVLQPGLPARDILDDLFWAAVAFAILVMSFLSAYRKHSIQKGLFAGFWEGLASGVIACLTGLLFVVLGMSLLLHDPLNRAEWSARGATAGTPDMAIYFAYETLAGALLHLVVLGIVMGIILGLVGGIAGKAANTAFKPSFKRA